MAANDMAATVISASPLTVKVDGADTACPAAKVSGLTLLANDRVQITIRTPQQPLITGKVV